MQYLTNNRLPPVTFCQDNIAKIIQNLESSEAHGHDNISPRILKICGPAMFKTLVTILKQCVDTGVSHLSGKRVILSLSIKKATKRH